MKKISDYTNAVECGIKRLKLPVDELPGLYEPIYYGLESGGKRLRPVLLLMVCDAFGGESEKNIIPAVGLEMFHNFTLLHDDVMDKSPMRRGRATVHTKWNENTAILSGDTMLTIATELIASVDDAKLRSMLTTFNKMAIDVYQGQQQDMNFETSETVELDEYMQMITGKTAALLGCAAKMGAIVAGASYQECDEMYNFGVALGLAFQIQDDYLDIYGDEKTFGKPIGGDILNNKKTYPILKALQMDSIDVKELKKAMELPADESKIVLVRDVLTRLGIRDICTEAIDRYSRQAIEILSKSTMSEQGKDALKNIVEKLIDRKK